MKEILCKISMKTIMFYPKVIIPVVSIIQSEDKSNKGNFEDFLETYYMLIDYIHSVLNIFSVSTIHLDQVH